MPKVTVLLLPVKDKTMQNYDDDLEIFSLFFSDDLSKIKCTATRTTLNITWQAIERNVFKNGSQGYRLTVWRISNETKIIKKDLNHSSNHYFLKKLGKTICLLLLCQSKLLAQAQNCSLQGLL